VVKKDQAAFLASIDTTQTAFLHAQQRVFANLQEVPFDSFERLILAWDSNIAPVRSRLQPHQDLCPRLRPAVPVQG